MRRTSWNLCLLGACLVVAGVTYALAQGESDKPRDEAKPPATDKQREQDRDKPRPPRPDGERPDAGPRPDGPPPPRREGEGPRPPQKDGPPRGEAGPRREGAPRPDSPQAGPRREGDRPDGPPPRREGEGPRPPRDGERPFPPGPQREGDGRQPPFGPPREGDIDRLREQDPEMFELMRKDFDLDRECHELSEQFRRAPGVKEKAELEKKVNDLVRTHFDVRQKRRELELQRLEDQLSRLRESIKTRVDTRDEIIRRRVLELIGRPEDAGF